MIFNEIEITLDRNTNLSTEIALSTISIAFLTPFVIFSFINIYLLYKKRNIQLINSINTCIAFFIIILFMFGIGMLLADINKNIAIILIVTSIITIITTFKLMFNQISELNLSSLDKQNTMNPIKSDSFYYK